MDVVRLLAHTNDPARRLSGGGQVNVGQFGDRVAQGVVEVTRSHISAVNMSDDSPGGYAGQCAGHRFDPIAQNHDDVGVSLLDKLGDSLHAAGESSGLIQWIVSAGLHLDSRIDGPTLIDDLFLGASELGEQVHSGHHELELDLGMIAQSTEGRFEKAELGSRARNHGDATSVASTLATCHSTMSQLSG